MPNKFNIIKKNTSPIKIVDKILPTVSVTDKANKLKNILPIILTKTITVFLHKTVLVNPLSDAPNIDNIKKETNANISENTTAKIILGKNP